MTDRERVLGGGGGGRTEMGTERGQLRLSID